MESFKPQSHQYNKKNCEIKGYLTLPFVSFLSIYSLADACGRKWKTNFKRVWGVGDGDAKLEANMIDLNLGLL